MPDVFTKAKRSEVMARIRSRGNRDTELALARLLRVNHITGWRRQIVINVRSSRRKEAQTENRKSEIGNQKLIGASSPRLLRVKVDFVFRQVRLALFVDGCFWHGCPRHATKPKNNRAFWRRKLAGNPDTSRGWLTGGWCGFGNTNYPGSRRRFRFRCATTRQDAMARQGRLKSV